MLAVRPSFRGARLHTFQPEDTRVYTSTPTKIGGHCLDHVRNGLTLNLSGAASQGAAQASGKRAREPAAASTFDPKGRFGGLCGVVLKLYPPAPSPPGGVFRKLEQQLQHQQRILCASLEHYPLYLAPTTLPPDTLTVAVEAGGQRYGPEWPSERTVSEARRNGSSGEVIEGRFHNMNRHARHMAASATGHSGALMAILLAKLANGGDEAAAGSPGAFPRADMEVSTDVDVATAVVAGAVGEIPVDSTKDVVQEGSTCTSILVAKSPVSMTRGNNTSVSGSSETWAWKARVDQTPRHSKLRRYSFVRKLGRGSHGTILLVRKTCGSTTCTRVLKESEYLPEAVNEARLLLLAGGSGVGGRVAPQGRADVISVHYNPRKVSAESPVVPKRRSSLGVEGAAVRELAAADAVSVRSGESHQRGDVIQLHDFFVETIGQRSLAFLELEYCEGGDLHALILGMSHVNGKKSLPRKRFAASGDAATGSRALSPGRCSGLPAAKIARVALGLCEGVQRLHERGVLHRDLKPANVLFTKSGAVRIADLGVSTCLQASRPLTENAAGTIPFMAPEVRKFLLGSKVAYSGKADVWAIGALVYAMAVGDPAPSELTTAARAELVSVIGHQTGSDGLSLVAHRALDPDPTTRPSVHKMKALLEDCGRREGWLPWSSDSDRTGPSSVRKIPTPGLARL